MEKSFLLRNFIFFSLALLFFFPLIHILLYVPWKPVQWDPLLWKVVLGAFIQASMSTVLTLVFGFLSAFGYLNLFQKLKPKTLGFIGALVLFPSFIPPLVLVVIGVKAMGLFPAGLKGIVFFHVIMNMGVVGLLVAKHLLSKAELWARLALVENVSFVRFFIMGIVPNLLREIKLLILFLFMLFFLSFSIPLLLGDFRFGGIEVFIYEKIFLYGDWSEAIQYSLSLMLALFAISFLTSSDEAKSQPQRVENLAITKFSHPLFIFILLSPPIFVFFGLFKSIMINPQEFVVPWNLVQGTMTVGLLTGISVFLLLSLISYAFISIKVSKSLLALVSPSWVVIGFSFLLLGSNEIFLSFFKSALALSILYIPYLYRLSFYPTLTSLQHQIEVGQVCGASWNKIFFIILWPQTLPTICFLSGIAALWASGDFALTGMLFNENTTIALQMKSLLMNYRLDQAIVLLLPLIVASIFVYLIFQGFSYVCRKSLLS